MDNDSIKPFYLSYGEYSLLCYVFISTKAYRVTVKIFYGCCFFYLPLKVFRFYTGSSDLNSCFKSKPSFLKLESYLKGFLMSSKAIEKFSKKGIELQGEMFKTDKYVYVLGEKKDIVFSPIHQENSFYGRNLASVETNYSSMALFHFKKRVDYYCPLMELPYKPEVDLSKAIDYLGVNNIKNHLVRFNKALYAFNPEVSDAVVVHELAHCLVRNHTQGFYDIVIKYCPDYYRYENLILSGKFSSK